MKSPVESLDKMHMDSEGGSSQASRGSHLFGLSGRTAVEDGGNGTYDRILMPGSIAIFSVAERQTAHFRARINFQLTTASVKVDDLKLELPNSNMIVYYLKAVIGNTSVCRIGIQQEKDGCLVYNFGGQHLRSSVKIHIRGSFKYLENPGAGLVTLVFPSLVGGGHREAAEPAASAGRRFAEDLHGRELHLEVQCLITLPAPCISCIGCPVTSVSPDGCRVFLRHTELRNIWDSAEFCLLCGVKNPDCPYIILQHPNLHGT